MNAVNDYRAANHEAPLAISRNLSFLAAWRANLKMLGIDLQQVPITQATVAAIAPRPGPGYALREIGFGGNNIEGAFRDEIGTPDGALDQLVRSAADDPVALLNPFYEDIGAAILCDVSYCAYVVIFGSTRQLQ